MSRRVSVRNRTSVLDRAAEQLVNMDNANYADERERSVYLEAQTFGMQLSVLACWLGALLFALFGQILIPLVLILLPLVPALGALWYAKRRGVNQYRVTARGPITKTLAWTGFYGLLLFLTCLALIHRAYYGEGVWEAPTITVEVVGEELQNAMAVGAILGMGLAAFIAVLAQGWIVWNERRKERRELEQAESIEAEEKAAEKAAEPTPTWLLRLGVIAGVFVALMGQLPWMIGGRDGFVVALAVLSLGYGATMVLLCLFLQRRQSAARS